MVTQRPPIETEECAHGNKELECSVTCANCPHACKAHDYKFGCKEPHCECLSSAGQRGPDGECYY